jgi:hypothetical protein
MRAHDKQFPQISIAHLRDAAQPLLAAGNTLWGETRELVTVHWDAIKRVATVLAAKDILTSDELAITFSGSKK